MGRNQARIGHAGSIPSVWLFTDERIARPELIRACARLPRGAGIILRQLQAEAGQRRALFLLLRRMATRRGLRLLLAGTVAQARAWQADGAHGRPRRGEQRQSRPPGLLRTIPAHDRRELHAATRCGADAIFLSPLFATRSHPGQRPLGPVRFASLARLARLAKRPVLALGGVQPRHAGLITRLGAAGYGAIDGLVTGRARQNLKAVPMYTA